MRVAHLVAGAVWLLLSTVILADSPTIQAPTTGGLFRVDPATGSLTPLETWEETVMEGSRYSYTYYLPGATSPVAIPYGQSIMFIQRLGHGSSPADLRVANILKIERLAVKNGRRYATKQYEPFDVSEYGELLTLTDSRTNNKRVTRAFLYKVRMPLPPGEYVLSAVGLLAPESYPTGGRRYQTFSVVRAEAAPASQPSAAPTVSGALAVTAPPQSTVTPAPTSWIVDADAKATADKFMGAAKIASEVPDARQTVRELSWVEIHPPELIGETTIYEGMFDTDIQGIKGYKRLIEAKVRSQASTELTARYVLVAYRDRTSGTWKVFDIRDLKGASSAHEVEETAKGLEDTRYTKKQVNYRRYAYWLAFDGKVGMAKKAYDQAVALNNADPDPNWAKFETGRFQALQAIIGQ